MIRAEFSGGPFTGAELYFVSDGAPPGFVMLIEHPTDADFKAPLIVGADFDDGWPGQSRYQLHSIYDAHAPTPTAIYEYAGEET